MMDLAGLMKNTVLTTGGDINMAQTSKVTDCDIANARLDFLYSKSPITEWKDLPYFGKASSDSSGGYSCYGKVAYSFRQPEKGGHWTAAAKIQLRCAVLGHTSIKST